MLINGAGVSIKLACASILLCLLGTANDTKVKLQIVNKTVTQAKLCPSILVAHAEVLR
jgi:hypothetical protein